MDNLVNIGSKEKFKSSHRHVLSWRSYRDPSLHNDILLFRFPAPPIDDQEDGQHDTAEDEWRAMESECPHLAAPLEHAEIEDLEDFGKVVVCPWHNYDFRLDTGESQTGMKACTFAVEIREGSVWIQPPGKVEDDWRLLSIRPVSEKFATARQEPLQTPSYDPDSPPKTLVSFCRLILLTSSPLEKVSLVRELVSKFRSGHVTRISSREDEELGVPDEPPREDFKVVGVNETGKRGKGGTKETRAKLLHALAWIELWAIDLAIDICARFATWKVGSLDGKKGTKLPLFFFSDFLKVAEDEAKHFSLLKQRIEELGFQFGQFNVHNGLWESATVTSHSLFSRLAIIHLVHEARGLDVNPRQIQRCRQAGDKESAEVMTIIHNDEVTHVAAGHRHFQYLCQKNDPPIDPVAQFREEVMTHFHGKLKGPFNLEDRARAGLTEEWYVELEGKKWDECFPKSAAEDGLGDDAVPSRDVGLEKAVEGLKA
ncbi:DUF455-domain-containing protein [Meredithblackwellia eburnea MCA 4105]